MDIFSDEFRKKVIARRELLEKQVRIEDGHVVVNVAYDYNIPLGELDSAEKILSWVMQLCEKTWITSEVIERFISVAAQHHGIKIPR